MRTGTTTFLFLFAAPLCFGQIALGAEVPVPEMRCDRPVESFSALDESKFPPGWTSADDKQLKKHTEEAGYYRIVKEDGNTFLRATSAGNAFTIHKDVSNWDLNQYPYLRWRWRAKQFPKNANEKYIRSNDAAAAVYVIWKASAIMKVKSIKFTWSSTLDAGTEVSKRFGLDHVRVLQNQKSEVGEWIEETVDVRALFQRFYEVGADALEAPLAIAVLSDSDATKSTAEADYDDFTLCQGAAPSPKPASVAAPTKAIIR